MSKLGCVVCIEIGTSRSGCAYAFQDNPSEILSEQNWPHEQGAHKTRSVILLNKEGKLVSFGQKAVNEYLEFEADQRDFLFVDDERKDVEHLLFFRNFKMGLYGDSISKDPLLKGQTTNAKPVERSAMEIFAETFKFFKDHIMHELALSNRQYLGHDITWVVTVPALWSEGAKQLMCEAAVTAGLCTDPKDVVICLEPEAASQCIFSRMKDRVFPPETVYMVCDCGGGTVDITVHQMTKDGCLKEVVCRSGGKWGSVCIDENFVLLLDQVFGKEVMDYYRENYPQEWEETLLNFEVVKMTTTLPADSKSRKIRMSQFTNSCVAVAKKQPGELCASAEGIEFLARGVLSLSCDRVLALFRPVVQAITEHVEKVLEQASKCQFIFLVGGLAESPVLKDSFDKAFNKRLEVIRPAKASLAVLTGGVMFGLNPSTITRRISKFGYGIDSHGPFDAAKHDPAKKVVLKDGRVRCEKLLSYHITAGQEVGRDEKFQRCYGPLYNNQETVDLRIIQTSDSNTLYSDESSCVCVGVLSLRLDQSESGDAKSEDESKKKLANLFRPKKKAPSQCGERDIMVQISVGGTMVKVTAIDVVSGKSVDGHFCALYDGKKAVVDKKPGTVFSQ